MYKIIIHVIIDAKFYECGADDNTISYRLEITGRNYLALEARTELLLLVKTIETRSTIDRNQRPEKGWAPSNFLTNY